RRHRPHPDDRSVRRPARDAPERLPEDRPRLDAHEHRGRVRRGRRARLDLSPGGDRRRHRLHGRARRRALPLLGGDPLNDVAETLDPRAELADLASATLALMEWYVSTGAAGVPFEGNAEAALATLALGPTAAPSAG